MRPLPVAQNSFRSGELSDLLSAREDITAYQHGAKSLLNWRLLSGGGISRRPGLQWHALLSGHAKLMPFIFDDDEEYVMALTATQIDIYLISYDGDTVLTELVQTIGSQPWTAEGVHFMDHAQKLDTMFFASGDGSFVMKKLKRTGLSTFTISDYAFEENTGATIIHQPYYKFADFAVTLTPSATTGSINLTVSAAHWTADHIGTIVRYIGKEVEITSITSDLIAVGTVRNALAGTAADADWDEAVFSAQNGYQRAVGFHESRLAIGGSRDLPNILFMSNTGAYYKFEVTTALDDESFDRPIDSGVVEKILWLNSDTDLEVYTDFGFHVVKSSETKPMTPTSAPRKKQGNKGCHPNIKPVSFDGATIFIQKNGKVAREVIFSDTSSKYNANNLSVLSGHLLQTPFDMDAMNGDFQIEEDYAMVTNAGDGSMAVFHSIREEQAAGWVPWKTEGAFHSVSTVGDHTFVVVARTTAGNPWSEDFSDDFGQSGAEYHLELLEKNITLDMAMTVTAPAPTVTFPGFTHLAGRTVHVVTRNAIYHGTFEVPISGIITIDEKVTSITAGLNYIPVLKTLRPKVDRYGFVIMAEIKRAISIVLQLTNVLSLTGNGHKLLVRRAGQDFSEDPTAISGDREIILQGYSRDGEVEITQEEPLPCTIKGFQMTIGVR